jgi:hypothetical protein
MTDNEAKQVMRDLGMLAAYRDSHARLTHENARGLTTTCIKDSAGDTRCRLCKKYDQLYGAPPHQSPPRSRALI